MMNKSFINRRGMTLTEVIFVSIVAAVILAMASLAFRGSFEAWRSGTGRTELIQMARIALDQIAREIRSAHNFGGSSDSTNLYYTASDGTFKQFQLDVPNNVLRYGNVGTLSDLVAPIEAGSSFTYYRDDGVTVTTRPSQIRSVLVTIEVSDPDGIVGNITASSRVRRRMENRWPKYHKDRQSLGLTYELMDPNSLVSRWTTANLGCRFHESSPSVSDDIVYIGCSNSTALYALDSNDGSTIWSSNVFSGDVDGAPVIEGNRVYVAADDRVYAFNKNSGSLIASVLLDENVDRSSPVVYGNGLYIATDRYVYRFNTANGQRIWKSVQLAGDLDFSTPAISGNALYIGAGDEMQALYLSTGALIWGGGGGGSGPIEYVDGSRRDRAGNTQLQFQITNTSGFPITVSSLKAEYTGGFRYRRIRWQNTRVWNGSNFSGDTANFSPTRNINPGQTRRIRIEQFSGQIDQTEFTITLNEGLPSESVFVVPVISVSGGGQFQSSPAVFNGVVYIGNDDRRLYAYDAADGSNLWRSNRLGGQARGSPAVSDDGQFVYVGAGRRVRKLNTSNGSQVWRTRNLDQDIRSAIVLSGNYVYVSSGQYLYAINDSNGSTAWRSPALSGNTQYSSPAIVNGLIYVGTRARRVHGYGL